MAIIKCKMCGGDIELTADKTFGTCEFCGSTMTLPKIDDEQRAAAFNRGNHFRRIGEFDKALAVYERIVREDDTDAEAHWCCALCRFGIEYVEDPATYEYLPTCHRASFDSFLEDVDYLAAVEHSDGVTKRQYQRDAAKIAEVQRGILAASQNAEPYDVFICYKESDENGNRTRDSLLAQDIYYQLTEQGRKVFFARITLEDVAGTQYEPYIFAALNSAKVMIVVGTKAEYLNAVWVKNEWSRFLAMMKKDRHKILLPCYRDMDPYDMPEALSVLQSYDMSKIGFIQDLTRGIAKVLDTEKKAEVVKEAPLVQQPVNAKCTALLKRGNMALEDGEWDKADGFFEEVLNQDAECLEAYLGKLLAEYKCSKKEALRSLGQPFDQGGNYRKLMRFADAYLKKELEDYLNEIRSYTGTEGCIVKDGVLEKYKGTAAHVWIPRGVTKIKVMAFASCRHVESVVIPYGVSEISSTAFANCEKLASVSIPDTVTRIGVRSFFQCGRLTSIAIPSSVEEIGENAFLKCDNLAEIKISGDHPVFTLRGSCLIDKVKGTVLLGKNFADVPTDGSVKRIGNSVFAGCADLINLRIPNGVTSIGFGAFCECKNLTSVTIPGSVVEIGQEALNGCDNLTDIRIPESHPVYTVKGNCIIDKEKKTVIFGNGSSIIPSDGSVSCIGASAFSHCKNLTSVTIPDSVTDIEEVAFSSCSNLTAITMPNGLTSIGEGAFFNCEQLTAITLPESVTSIGKSAFGQCKNLVAVTIPNSLTSISDYTFLECENLTSVTIPNSVTSIGYQAFGSCRNLTSITIPNSVSSIGEAAFFNCKKLVSVTIPDGIISIGDSEFIGCENLTFITIPGSVTAISDMAFRSCPKVTIYTKPGCYTYYWAKRAGIPVEEDEASKAERLEKEEKRIAHEKQVEEAWETYVERKQAGRCTFCGGTFKGLFAKKCTNCGKGKDY